MQNTESKMNAIWTEINGEIERAALPSREGRRGRTPPVNLTQWITENCPDLYKWALAHDSRARYDNALTDCVQEER
jgi:hypothetical protein